MIYYVEHQGWIFNSMTLQKITPYLMVMCIQRKFLSWIEKFHPHHSSKMQFQPLGAFVIRVEFFNPSLKFSLDSLNWELPNLSFVDVHLWKNLLYTSKVDHTCKLLTRPAAGVRAYSNVLLCTINFKDTLMWCSDIDTVDKIYLIFLAYSGGLMLCLFYPTVYNIISSETGTTYIEGLLSHFS